MTIFGKENVFIYILSFQSVSVEIKNYLAPEPAVGAERNRMHRATECHRWKGPCLGVGDTEHRSLSVWDHVAREWLCGGLSIRVYSAQGEGLLSQPDFSSFVKCGQ